MFKQKNWWLTILFSVTFLMSTLGSLFPVSAQTQFKDIQGHWAKPCIEQLAQKRIINGYPDGSFKPNSPVTRAEFAALVDSVFSQQTEVRQGGNFVDVPASHWAVRAIKKAYNLGFLSGYPGQVFSPNQNIPRVQAIVALANGLKLTPTQASDTTLKVALSDASAIPDYAKNPVAAAIEKQLVVNYPTVKNLNPNQLASRAEIATFLCQALGYSQTVPAQYIPKTVVSSVPNNPPPIVPSKNGEIRGIWLTNIDSQVLFSKQNITTAVQRLSQMNFNTLYPTVWNWGYTLYPSKVAEKATGKAVRLVTPLDRNLDPDYGTKDRDMLKEMIEIGHKNGMSVMPWFEFGFMLPGDSEIAKRHPDWITSRLDGSQHYKEGIHDRVWLNPFHPEVQEFIISLVTEVVKNYDVDGIQFDDHFGLPAEFGYDTYTVNLYQQEIGQRPSNDFQETFWIRWRADKINNFMSRLFRAVKDINKDCIVSLSPNPLHYALPAHLQDWFTWERKGWIEELIIQVYRNELSRFIAELDREEVQLAKDHIPVAIGVLTGLRSRPVSLSQIQSQVQAVRQRNFAGVSFFFYESLSNWANETPVQRETAFKQLFPEAVKRPKLVTTAS
jgi:uncharacterized lipoprotein YddW (UPF0748 family)